MSHVLHQKSPGEKRTVNRRWLELLEASRNDLKREVVDLQLERAGLYAQIADLKQTVEHYRKTRS